jgi:hypothetical protein
MIVYIEFISRRPGISIEHFHAIAGAGQTGWAKQYGDDELVLNLGRTWRVGPEPEYLAVWLNRNAGLELLGEWERAFRSGEADAFEKPMEVVGRLDRAGCYRPLREPVAGRIGPYYAEFLDFAPGATPDEVAAFFDKRAGEHPALQLHLVADRIGHLGPDPRCIAVWGLPDYAHLNEIASELQDVTAPVVLRTAGIYANLGEEIL